MSQEQQEQEEQQGKQNAKPSEERRRTILNPEVTEKMVDILTLYIQSINLYRTLGLLAQAQGLLGCGEYLFIQRKERSHSATELHRFLDDAGAMFTIPTIEEPNELSPEATIEDIFLRALDNEIAITDLINEVASIATEEKQFTAFGYLQEELKFQLGEEGEARDRVAIVKASDCPVTADIKITTLIKKRKKKKR